MNTSKIVKLAIAALFVSQAGASQSTSQLVSEALAQVQVGSQEHLHLSNALEALTGTKVENRATQDVVIPIDEKRAMSVRAYAVYELDTLNSITLKSFRKVVGYDTFDAIRKKSRNELKDVNDYYNVTVSMLVQRRPEDRFVGPARDPYNPDGAPSLAATLDKGFPYDD